MAASARSSRRTIVAALAPTALLALALVACTPAAPPETAEDRPTDLRRSGSVSDRTGAAVPLALCARSAGLARALDLPPELLRLPAACGAAGRL